MSAASRQNTAPDGPTATTFRAALAAALPEHGLWTMPVVVGVSGGADSVALLHGLCRHVGRESGRIVVAHAEHDLRPEAATDRQFVTDLASSLGLECVVCTLAVRDTAVATNGERHRGEGLEARARRLRYGFLADAAHAVGARHVLVAHTADDQAETVLHRMLRGTGLSGLAGMPRARELCTGVALLRPLLDVPRAATRAYLTAVGQPWCEDATNADTARARNFLRHEVLPRCEAGPYPAASAALVRLAGQAAGAARSLGSVVEMLLDRHVRHDPDGAVVLHTRDFKGFDPHLLGEITTALWRREGWPRRDMTASHYAGVAALLADPGRSRLDLPGGLRVVVESADRVRIVPAAITPRPGRACPP
jgi:tRNA(Ile)-lysidine synthase